MATSLPSRYWITWMVPGIYASKKHSTMPLTLDEARAKFPAYLAMASERGWRTDMVQIVDADHNTVTP